MVSFDIFDTLVTRTVWEPFGIFLLMQKTLTDKKYDGRLPEYARENFAVLRQNAEAYARRFFEHAGKEEATLAEIYATFSQMAGLPEGLSEELMEFEIQTEINHSVPVLANIECLKSCLRRGERVILVSDMYLPKEAIKELLRRADPVLPGLPLYLSCECGKTKKNGTLYAHIKGELGVRYPDWTHYGDNGRSDVKVPGLLGMKAIPVRIAGGWKGQGIPEDGTVHGDLEKQLFLGAARNAIENYSLMGAGAVGAAAGGTLLYPYVSWVVKTSAERGYGRLYFISRDGFVLKKTADKIISACHYGIETYYLYGSRKAWRVEDEASQALLARYLRQEAAPFDGSFAFVDLQGTGKSMVYAAQQIRKSADTVLPVFYYQMYDSVLPDGCEFLPFCTLGGLKFLEPFARAPHGAVLGYEKRDGRVGPRLAESGRDLWERCGLFDYVRGVELFSEELSLALKKAGIPGASPGVALWMARRLQEAPDKRVLGFIGDMPHNDTTDDKSASFAPKLSMMDIYKIYLWRTVEPLGACYRGTCLLFSLKRMGGREERWKQFCERHTYGFLGSGLHKLKSFAKKKRHIPGYEKIVLYAAGQEGKWLFQCITYGTKSKVVGWTDINYRELRGKGVPVTSLEKALEGSYDGVVVAIQKRATCETVKEMLVSKGVDRRKIMGLEEFKLFLGSG